MFLLGKIKVKPVIPERLSRLYDIAYNLWWSWNQEAIDLFRELDEELWTKVESNPVRFIQEASYERLLEKMADPGYMDKYHKVVADFDSYMNKSNTWFERLYPDKTGEIAYFSAEYGLSEVLPIYSGGLGVLSGDHCKSASDLGLPFTAVGLFYKHGYFHQHINLDGWQETIYPHLDPSRLPIRKATGKDGNEVKISVELPGRMLFLKVWKVSVGRINLYLLDSDVDENSASDRSLTGILYGGDQETRIQQEIILGIGGYRALKALGINPDVYHMNEGHSAFLGLELIKSFMREKGFTFREAREAVASCLVFTTHTSVPAGNDVFPYAMIDKYFHNYWDSLGISRHEFLDLGAKPGDHYNFNMTILALKLAGRRNGVSELHGAVSRNIFCSTWNNMPEDEVPIGHITNGVHTFTWLNRDLRNLFDKYLDGDWKEKAFLPETWNDVENIPNSELWTMHLRCKKDMIDYLRGMLKLQRMKNAESSESMREADKILNPDVLTIGFARRFATYKRADLIFKDIDRIRKILNNPDRPVQVIFAGKAHPADRPAHEIIKQINDISRLEGFKGKILLLENYNMQMARKLISGVDVWLNNPRRPLEASGTSGQKAAVNGILNFSVLDGWWCEGYNGKNGWIIGSDMVYDDDCRQDYEDSLSLYEVLENEIIPLYYCRDEQGIPQMWIEKMKESVKTTAYRYSTHRMVIDYTNKMYIPSIDRIRYVLEQKGLIKELSEWKQFVEKNWASVSIEAEKTMDKLSYKEVESSNSVKLTAVVHLGDIPPAYVKVETYYGKIQDDNTIEDSRTAEMNMIEETSQGIYKYSTDIAIKEGGEYGYTFRVIPHHPNLINKFETGLIRWVV